MYENPHKKNLFGILMLLLVLCQQLHAHHLLPIPIFLCQKNRYWTLFLAIAFSQALCLDDPLLRRHQVAKRKPQSP